MNVLEWAASVLGTQGTSGAIDVVAITKSDGTIGCSPFHVKLTQGARNKPSSRVVKLKVNGSSVPLSMKVGRAGEAFFLERKTDIVSKKFTKSSQDTLNDDSIYPMQSKINQELDERRPRSYSTGDVQIDKIEPLTNDNSNGNNNNNTLVIDNIIKRESKDHLDKFITLTPPEIDASEFAFRRSKRSVSDMSNYASQNQSTAITTTIPKYTDPINISPLKLRVQDNSTSTTTNTNDTNTKKVTNNDKKVHVAAPQSARLPEKDTKPNLQNIRKVTSQPSFAWSWSWGTLPVRSPQLQVEEAEKTRASDSLIGEIHSAVDASVAATNSHDIEDKDITVTNDQKEIQNSPRYLSPNNPDQVVEVTVMDSSFLSLEDENEEDNIAMYLKNDTNTLPKIQSKDTLRKSNISTIADTVETNLSKDILDNIIEPELLQSIIQNNMGTSKFDPTHHIHINTHSISNTDNSNDDKKESKSYIVNEPKLFSMCGHILASESDAPEPCPSNTMELQAVLNSYSIPSLQLNKNIIHDKSLVVMIDDYLVPVTVLIDIMSDMQRDIPSTTSSSNSDNSLSNPIINSTNNNDNMIQSDKLSTTTTTTSIINTSENMDEDDEQHIIKLLQSADTYCTEIQQYFIRNTDNYLTKDNNTIVPLEESNKSNLSSSSAIVTSPWYNQRISRWGSTPANDVLDDIVTNNNQIHMRHNNNNNNNNTNVDNSHDLRISVVSTADTTTSISSPQTDTFMTPEPSQIQHKSISLNAQVPPERRTSSQQNTSNNVDVLTTATLPKPVRSESEYSLNNPPNNSSTALSSPQYTEGSPNNMNMASNQLLLSTTTSISPTKFEETIAPYTEISESMTSASTRIMNTAHMISTMQSTADTWRITPVEFTQSFTDLDTNYNFYRVPSNLFSPYGTNYGKWDNNTGSTVSLARYSLSAENDGYSMRTPSIAVKSEKTRSGGDLSTGYGIYIDGDEHDLHSSRNATSTTANTNTTMQYTSVTTINTSENHSSSSSQHIHTSSSNSTTAVSQITHSQHIQDPLLSSMTNTTTTSSTTMMNMNMNMNMTHSHVIDIQTATNTSLLQSSSSSIHQHPIPSSSHTTTATTTSNTTSASTTNNNNNNNNNNISNNNNSSNNSSSSGNPTCNNNTSSDDAIICTYSLKEVINTNNNNDSIPTTIEHLSLEDITYEMISPEPAAHDFYDSDTDSYLSSSLEDGEGRNSMNRPYDSNGHIILPIIKNYKYRKVLVPSQDELKSLNLLHGENEILFEIDGFTSLKSQLFVWPEYAKIVIVDTEGLLYGNKGTGTIWQSFLVPQRTQKKSPQVDMAQLLSEIHAQGYHILYMSQNIQGPTKEFLAKLATSSSSSGCTLPPGPIFQSPDSLVRAFGAERTDLFKAAALRGLKSLFPSTHNPFFASFGVRHKDCLALSRCGVPEGRIFLITPTGDIILNNNRTIRRSIIELNQNIQEMFPPLISKLDSGEMLDKKLTNIRRSILCTDYIYDENDLGNLSDVVNVSSKHISQKHDTIIPSLNNINHHNNYQHGVNDESLNLIPSLNLLTVSPSSKSGLNSPQHLTPSSKSNITYGNITSRNTVYGGRASMMSTIAVDDEYNDHAYWKVPIPTIDDF